MTDPAAAPLSPLHAMLPRVERHFHARRLNEIGNHPSVFPWIRGWLVDKIDFSAAVADPKNIFLVGMHGAIAFEEHQAGLYGVHSMCLKEGRGRWMLAFAEACLHLIFTATSAMELLTRVPKGNLGARALCRATGWTYEFTNQRGWIKDLDPIPADIFALRIQDWARTAPGLAERGNWFHDRLEAEFARHGKAEKAHPDDAVHDRAVGLAVEMMFAGQPDKAVILYNRWAVAADYQQIAIANYDPLLIEMVSAQVMVNPKEESFWVPLVR